MRRRCRRPTVAADALPGFALSQAISSLAFFGGSAFLPTIISGVALIREIGCNVQHMRRAQPDTSRRRPTWLVQLPMLSV